MTTFPRNQDRAERFAGLLALYDSDDTNSCRLTDLLTDARHWCDRQNQCYGTRDRVAYDHYLAEFAGERQERKHAAE